MSDQPSTERQATVSRFDADTASGALLFDDGVAATFDAHSMQFSGLRLLRSGQRVKVRVAGPEVGAGTGADAGAPPRILALTLVTFDLPPDQD